jgi:hypothetical protein
MTMDSRVPPNLETLKGSLAGDKPPEGLGAPLTALWHAGKGDTTTAHSVIAKDTSKAAEWVRAHLHRRDGDDQKAAECYDRADKNPSLQPVDREWSEVAAGLLLNVQ